MKKISLLSALFATAITPTFAGTVHLQNIDITPGRCVLKFYTTWDKSNQSNNTASQVMAIPGIGASVLRNIPNGMYQAIIMDCKIDDGLPRPSDLNPKGPAAYHITACNSDDKWSVGMLSEMRPIVIKANSPGLAISVDFGGKKVGANTNSGHCAFINMHEFQ